jgi:hypothetical protein
VARPRNRWTRLSEREKLRLLAGNQIINPSASSAIACDVSAIGIRQDRVMYGGEGVGGILGLLESSSTPYRSGIQSLNDGIPLLPRFNLATVIISHSYYLSN